MGITMNTPKDNKSSTTGNVTLLAFFFGLSYFAQGIGQHVGLVSQPLKFFFKETLGMNPAQTTEFLAILTIPWMIKPLYGLLSDFFPLFGYRRKSWLLVTNLAAAGGFLWLTGLSTPSLIVTALFLTALGTAASDVLIDAIMVEKGQLTGMTARFQSVQWTCISIASVGSSLAGGYLCTIFKDNPASALHVAAMITLFAPVVVLVSSWLIVKEQRSTSNIEQMKIATAGLWTALRSKTLWAVAFFLAFWYFSPSLGNVWYYHQSDTLQFSQGFIGTLDAIAAGGQLLGAILYGVVFAHRSLRSQLLFSIATGTVGSLAYLLLLTPSPYAGAIAIGINLVFGAASMIAVLSTMTLAAQACPGGAEGFTFAALMSVTNGFTQISAIVGARLFVSVFQSLTPLILISAGFTAACIFLLPLLRGVPDKAKTEDDGAKKE